MLTRRSSLLITGAALLGLASPAFAHPHEPEMKTEQIAAIEQQIHAFRAEIRTAIAAKDVKRLRDLYASSFTHTHGSGKVDGRDARIVSVLAGEPVIETAKVDDLSIRVFHADTAIVSGKSPIPNMTDGKTYEFRWMAVYVRVGGEWHLASSQATRLPLTTS
jgi:ketosteroid isomerase-like protein